MRLGETVEEITVEPTGGKPRATGVRLASGERLAADVVVSNADAAWTYQKLVASPSTGRPGPTTSWASRSTR